MPKPNDTKLRVMPSALPPTESERAEWGALSRDEQIQRYREALLHPDCGVAAEENMDTILGQAQERIAARRGSI